MSDNTDQISIQELFENHGERLELEWVAGKSGGKKFIVSNITDKTGKAEDKYKRSNPAHAQSLVGYLNLIHPHQIQILGQVELDFLEELRDISRQDAVQQLFSHNPACIIVADKCKIPVYLKRRCNENTVPLFTSPLSSNALTDSLHYYLTNLFAEMLTLHGVYMEVNAIGVLITGPSGVGKSELALELITRGHRLVADDAPQFSRIAPDIINGTCPPALQDFLEVRGLGIINVRELFGDSSIKKNKYLKLIIRLEPLGNDRDLQIDRLEGSYKTLKVLDLEIPEITLPVAPGRNLAVLLECAASNHILRISGYNASVVFANRQKKLLEREKSK